MKKNLKKLIALGLALACLAGCGSANPGSNSAPAASVPADQKTETEETPATGRTF